jgi:predicted RNA-binding protein YlqC (UPF0109 family)
MSDIKNLLEYILKGIIKENEDIVVEEKDENNMTLLEISAPTEKIGQIIGKQGKIIKAIRTIISISFPQSHFNIVIKE